MANVTPRRSVRVPHNHTPKMSDRKKGLFQSAQAELKDSLTKHRRLPVVESESDGEECDLGIMGALDSSSGEENDQGVLKTPERVVWKETRSQTKKLIKETQDLKNFMKSPFTLHKYQTRYSGPEKSGSSSTPVTPHLQNHPRTPSSSHSCASTHSVSTTSSKARKSLASLIADTESCSSSLKDLNFDSDSGADSKENTPRSVRRSSRRKIMTPKFKSFKGVLLEKRDNSSPTPMITSPMKSTLYLSKPDISPTQLLKTPHNNNETCSSPPKLSHNRRSVVEIQESPESSIDDSDNQVQKRLRNDSLTDTAPNAKYPKLDANQPAPKARLSLFNSDRLKEILSAKSFYGKSNPDLNTSITSKINYAIDVTNSQHRRSFPQASSQRRKRKPGQINMGVKHRIKKPKFHRNKMDPRANSSINKSSHEKNLDSSGSNDSMNNSSLLTHNVSQDLDDKVDPFDNEKQTIEALLSQWTEEEIPEAELTYTKKPELPCFNKTVIEETSQIFQPVSAIPVVHVENLTNEEAVIVELGAPYTKSQKNNVNLPENSAVVDEKQKDEDVLMMDSEENLNSHGEKPAGGSYLPVEGGFLLVDSNPGSVQEELPDLDEIEREMRILDEQILRMAQSNNIDPDIVIASTESAVPVPELTVEVPVAEASTNETDSPKPQKVFPIFTNPNPGTDSTPKGSSKTSKKCIIKTGTDQYVIDAGQKKFGATQCPECSVIYQIGDPQDEHDHLVHHNATDVLKFQGWKEETLVGMWNEGSERCIRVRGGEPGWKKVETLLFRVIHPALGYADALPKDNRTYTAYLYVEKKQIAGCLIMEPKTKAHKLIPGKPDCCSVEEYSVLCGISRIWTHVNSRRRGIAHRMLDCARASFLYGAALRKEDIAFSAPTVPGKALAAKYCDTQNFLVYLD